MTSLSIAEALRGERSGRPVADTTSATGLRALLEDGLYDAIPGKTSDAPLVVRAGDVGDPPRSDAAPSPLGRLRGLLVATLLRLLSVGARVEDPFADAVAAWRHADAPGEMTHSLDALDGEDRARLSADVAGHFATLRAAWGDLPASWVPRTSVRASQRLSGGRVVLRDQVDLMVGTLSDVASVALLDLTSSPLGDSAPRVAAYHALVHTLRTSVSPLRTAVFSSASGELYWVDVDHATLVGAAHDVLEVLARTAAP